MRAFDGDSAFEASDPFCCPIRSTGLADQQTDGPIWDSRRESEGCWLSRSLLMPTS